jgi:CYTH domain-containing protein
MKTSTPKIQRRWVVTTLSPDLKTFFEKPANLADVAQIKQGYMHVSPTIEVIVRHYYTTFFGPVTTMTHRSKDDLAWNEHGVKFERNDKFVEATFSSGCFVGKMIEKTRFKTMSPDGTTKIEIDLFKGYLEGLTLIEVEFKSEQDATAYVLPAWLSGISREVTGDERFNNTALAIEGMPTL